MDIYVVSNLWGAAKTVFGAAVNRADAEGLANRHGGNYRWTEWHEFPSGQWERRALWGDGSAHPSHTQEIVVLPLAGYIEEVPISETPFGARNRNVLSDAWEIGHRFGAP